MANVLINETTMSAIGESIRTKGGTTAKLLPADMPKAITDIKSGIEPLDHTVTFMVDGNPYEIVSVKNGNSVNAPATVPTSASGSFNGWGQVLPFVPSGDVELNAEFVKESWADQLYNNYQISKSEYPYLLISVVDNGNSAYAPIHFGKTKSLFGSNEVLLKPSKHETAWSLPTGISDIETIAPLIIKNVITLMNDRQSNEIINADSGFSYYANFDNPTSIVTNWTII